MYVKLRNWSESDEQPDLKCNYPNKVAIEIYCNDEVKKKLTEDVIIEMAVDNILDYYDEQHIGK